MEGIIIKNESNNYTVRTNKGINICKPRGKFRLDKITPLVGDKVIIDDINNYLLEIKPRKNSLIRPQIANVDIALIVTSVKEPNFDSNLLDKLLTIISYNNIEPIICLTKTDLLNEEEEKNIKEIFNYYQSIGYTVVTNNDIKEIKKLITGKIVVFAGQSGAGKSSLLNKLDKNLNLETNEISKALGRGKHTTRCTTLYDIDSSLVADTPGFSSVDFRGMTKIDIRDNMNLSGLCLFNEVIHPLRYSFRLICLFQCLMISTQRKAGAHSKIGIIGIKEKRSVPLKDRMGGAEPKGIFRSDFPVMVVRLVGIFGIVLRGGLDRTVHNGDKISQILIRVEKSSKKGLQRHSVDKFLRYFASHQLSKASTFHIQSSTAHSSAGELGKHRSSGRVGH